MPRVWMDVSNLSFNSLLLLEEVQLSWFPGRVSEKDLAIALSANPAVEWFLRHKCPQLNDWLDHVMAAPRPPADSVRIRQAEIEVMASKTDLLVYAVDPAVYDAQPFLKWDTSELLSLADFSGKTVVDVGAGTGRLALSVAPLAKTVFAVEPVANLRSYLKKKSFGQGFRNIYVVDGLIEDIPFPDGFADITMGGHVFGDLPEEEYQELVRVTKPGGEIILCPANPDEENQRHAFLVSKGFQWSRFEEPHDGWKRKYWKKRA